MLKLIKKLIGILLFIIVTLMLGIIIFISLIKYEVTEDMLPEDVYETTGEVLPFAKLKMVELMVASEEDRYTLIEEIINLIIYDSIKKNVNEQYDPLGDCTEERCDTIFVEDRIYLDYVFAEMNDDQQLVVTISGGFDHYVAIDTAVILTFDVAIDLSLLNPTLVFTLANTSLGDLNISQTMIDRIFNFFDKDQIEESMTFGTLDLTDYTYSISLLDAIGG